MCGTRPRAGRFAPLATNRECSHRSPFLRTVSYWLADMRMARSDCGTQPAARRSGVGKPAGRALARLPSLPMARRSLRPCCGTAASVYGTWPRDDERHSSEDHHGPINHLQFAARHSRAENGNETLISAGSDRTVVSWDMATQTPRRLLSGRRTVLVSATLPYLPMATNWLRAAPRRTRFGCGTFARAKPPNCRAAGQALERAAIHQMGHRFFAGWPARGVGNFRRAAHLCLGCAGRQASPADQGHRASERRAGSAPAPAVLAGRQNTGLRDT